MVWAERNRLAKDLRVARALGPAGTLESPSIPSRLRSLEPASRLYFVGLDGRKDLSLRLLRLAARAAGAAARAARAAARTPARRRHRARGHHERRDAAVLGHDELVLLRLGLLLALRRGPAGGHEDRADGLGSRTSARAAG